MYNEKLDKLIEMALMDGELKEKEKKVLFKNAETMGVDFDEFEMVLEAKLFEKQKSMQQEEPKTKEAANKSDKYGDVKKCPACGSIVQSFQIKCIDCGHEFSNIESNASINKLFEILNDAENERKDERMSFGNALEGMFAKSFGLDVGNKVDSRKKTIISNFPIPTTKNDILEFLSLAIPNAKKAGNFFTSGSFNSPANHRNKLHNDFVTVWKAKCEQIIMKARFTMKEDKQTLEQIERYAKEIGL